MTGLAMQPEEGGTQTRPAILVVDDSLDFRAALVDWLRSAFAKFQIHEAQDGETALDRVRACAPRLVLMDVHMPGMGGLAACREMKVLFPALPVVMMSMHEERQTRRRTFDFGAQAFLHKRDLYQGLIPIIKELIVL